MKKIEPRDGESVQDYIKRVIAETHHIEENVIASITYQINGVDTDPMYLKLTPLDFKSRKISITFDAPVDKSFYWNAARLAKSKSEYRYDTFAGYMATVDELNMKFMNTDCKKNKIDTRLKRLLR